MKIGLSLSFCIQDIVAGRESLDDVVCILSGTKAETIGDFKNVVARYKDSYWSNNDEASKIAMDLYMQGRVLQPRTFGMQYLNIADGHWIELGTESKQHVELLTRN